MSRIERITRAGRGPEEVLRAQHALRVDRVHRRPERDPQEQADEQHDRQDEQERPRPHADADGHLDVRA